jgi:carboxyl-terminal processing protease
MTNNRMNYLLPTLLAVTLGAGMIIGNIFTPGHPDVSSSAGGEKYQKLQDIITILDRKYVDTINGEALFEQTIGDMLHKLDPHSNYIPAKDIQLMTESIEGQFGGIGVRFFIIRDTICVTNVVMGSPSQLVGVKAGDKLIEINGKPVAGKKITNEKVMSQLKGKPGTAVSVRLLRDGKKLNKRIVRDLIPIQSVVAAYMIDRETGYIKIDEFSMTTATEFRTATLWMKEQGMKKILLDLRNNGGGVMTAAIDIADEFLRNNVPIVKTVGEHSGTTVYRATAEGILHDTKVAVLINANSASASEILAGALQDNDRGTIVGRRSFGKGLVQEDVQLSDGSNLRLTIARYYTPTGRCIQKPYKEGFDDYYRDQMERYDNGELYKPDSTVYVDSLKYKTPKGKIVYGGGGIMPDVFVPFDSTGSSWYLTELRYSAAFNSFAFAFLDGKRGQFKNLGKFVQEFTVTPELMERFVRFAEKEMEVKRDPAHLKHSKKQIEQLLKAEVARQLWLEEGYYKVMNRNDKEVLKALSILK